MKEISIINLINSNDHELHFFLACLNTQIRNLEDENKRLKIGLKLRKFLLKIKKIKDKEKVKNEVEKFLSKKINKTTEFKDIVKIKFNEKGKLALKILPNKYFAKESLLLNNEEKDIGQNIKQKIIIFLIINFESFLSKLINKLITKNENFFFNLNKQDKKENDTSNTISYEEILKNPNKDFKQYIIDKVIQKLTYDALGTIDKIIKKTKLDTYVNNHHSELLSDFKEIYYRRNLIIHNNSIVNEQYINKTNQSLNIGDELKISDDYINKANNTCKKFACLIYAILGKLIRDNDPEKEIYYSDLSNYSFALLKLSKWKDALFTEKLLLDFYCDDNASMLNHKYNMFNCLKHLGDSSFTKSLNNIDVSALDVIYKIAKHLLLDENEKVYRLVKENYPKNITKKQILDWPIFKDFLTTNEFSKLKNEFPDDFEYFEI